MKRKEIADLLRSYRNDESIIKLESRKICYDAQLISLICTAAFQLPTAANSVNMAPLYGGIDEPIQACVCFTLDIK